VSGEDLGTGSWSEQVRWDANGLAPAIAQDSASGRVLMVAWMNREALAETARRGEAVYWSRSRQRLWHKGEDACGTKARSRVTCRRWSRSGSIATPT